MQITSKQIENYFDYPESFSDSLSKEELLDLEMYVGQVAADLGFLEDEFTSEDVQELLDAKLTSPEIEELRLAVLDKID